VLPHQKCALLLHESGLAETGAAQSLLEGWPIELAVGSAERGLLQNGSGYELVRHAEAERLSALIEESVVHEPSKDALIDPEGASLLGSEIGPELTAQSLDLIIVGGSELFHRDFGASDTGDAVPRSAPEDVADAPDREAEDQKSEQNCGNDLADKTLSGLSKTLKHLVPAQNSLGGADTRLMLAGKGRRLNRREALC
jgi:hypothetical protein